MGEKQTGCVGNRRRTWVAEIARDAAAGRRAAAARRRIRKLRTGRTARTGRESGSRNGGYVGTDSDLCGTGYRQINHSGGTGKTPCRTGRRRTFNRGPYVFQLLRARSRVPAPARAWRESDGNLDRNLPCIRTGAPSQVQRRSRLCGHAAPARPHWLFNAVGGPTTAAAIVSLPGPCGPDQRTSANLEA